MISNISLYSVISYAGHDWLVINLQNDVATLLAANYDFGLKHHFSKEADAKKKNAGDYKSSQIRKYLQYKVLPKLEKNGAKPIPTRLSDVDCTDKVWLLSIDEVKELPDEVNLLQDWWLRTADSNNSRYSPWVERRAAIFNHFMTPFVFEMVYREYAVRPAMRIKVKDLVSK